MRAFIFDLDGTLVDTVYAHIFAWQKTFEEADLPLAGWRVHRKIGMSGGLLTRAVARELGLELSAEQQKSLQDRHTEIYTELLPERQALPGAVDLIKFLYENEIMFGIATSGLSEEIEPSLKVLGIQEETIIVNSGDVERAKPEPDLFLACQQRLGVNLNECYVVGDAVWDLLAARRAGMLSIGVLCGGYGEDELIQAGAFRVYRDPGELHRSLDELGILP